MSRNLNNAQRGYTEYLQPKVGTRIASARAVNLDVHAKHCFEVARYLRPKGKGEAMKWMSAGDAIEFLEDVIKVEHENPRVRNKAKAVPYRKGSGNKFRKRNGPGKVGHRRGKLGPGRYPVKAAKEFIKLINSAVENARHRFDDVEPMDMFITHCAAHRGPIKRGWIPRARGRATPNNHHRVNLEIFLEDFDFEGDEDEF